MDVKDLLYIVPNDVTYNELYFYLIRNGFVPFWIPDKNAFTQFISNYDDIKLILIDESIVGEDLSIIQKIKFSPKTENSGIIYIGSSEEKANKAKFLGADYIVIKPLKNENLLEVLKEVLSKYNFYKNKYDIKIDHSYNVYPSLLLHFQKIANMLKTHKNVRVYAFEMENIISGHETEVTEHVINKLDGYISKQIPLKGKTLIFPFSQNSFIVMIFYPDNFAKNIFLEFTMDIEKLISEELKPYNSDYSYGFADSSIEIIENYEITIYSLLKKAFEVIWDTKNSKFSKYVTEFNNIIENQSIWSEYQPIIDLSDNSIWGYEGLSRGPANTTWQAPEYLFEMAFKFDRIVDLESICMTNTVEKFFYLKDAKRLFLNIHPFALEQLLDQLLAVKEKYKNLEIVLEVTEKKFIQDFDKFQSFFSLIRGKGIKIALDDVGSGYSSLQYLIELNIDYFKIDITLVQDINKNYLKRSVVSALVDIAREKNAKVIAEGIETLEELRVIKEFGIDFGQGFLFAKPSVRPVVNLKFED